MIQTLSSPLFLLAGGMALPIGSRVVELDSVAGELDPAALAPLLAKGLLGLVCPAKDGAPAQVTIMALANAPREKIWDTIVDYESYPKFMTRVKKTRIQEKNGNEMLVSYELDIPGIKVKYSMRHVLMPPGVIEAANEGEKGALAGGACRWELIPHDDGQKTLVCYGLNASLDQSGGWIIKQFLKAMPDLDVGISLVTGMVTVRDVIARAGG
ncbi:MAG: SRPBCC family protein [Desulfatibacillaceae bacterium]|nr:SRPBCC family protein [Desulfatibacillaceae bacterium]